MRPLCQEQTLAGSPSTRRVARGSSIGLLGAWQEGRGGERNRSAVHAFAGPYWPKFRWCPQATVDNVHRVALRCVHLRRQLSFDFLVDPRLHRDPRLRARCDCTSDRSRPTDRFLGRIRSGAPSGRGVAAGVVWLSWWVATGIRQFRRFRVGTVDDYCAFYGRGILAVERDAEVAFIAWVAISIARTVDGLQLFGTPSDRSTVSIVPAATIVGDLERLGQNATALARRGRAPLRLALASAGTRAPGGFEGLRRSRP